MPKDLLAEQIQQPTQQPQDLLGAAPVAGTTPMDVARNLLGFGKTAMEIPVVAGQDLGELVAGIPGAMPLARKITGALPENIRRGLATLGTDRVIDKPTLGARIGGGALAGITGAELPGAALGAIPKIAELVSAFPRLARAVRPLLLGAGGAAISPKHRLRGFLTGTALGAGLEGPGVAPEIVRSATGVATRLSPNRYAKEIVKNLPKFRSAEETLDNLSGNKTLNENSKILAKDIRNSYKKFKDVDSKNFGTVINKAGNESIYDETQLPSKDGYRILEKWKRSPIDNYTSTLKDAHEEFMDIPTFDKAHKLQSALGRAGSDLLKAPRSDIVNRDIGNRFLDARDRLLRDMNNHLNKIDSTGNLVNEYNSARNYHKFHVIPYEENSAIRKIAKGNIINPRNITTIFKNPEENVSKVVGDLGEPAREKIVYHELRKTAGQNPDAIKTVKAYEGLEKKGLNDYVSPKLDEQINNLRKKSAIDELVKGVGKKPTAESLIKAHENLERKGLDIHLSPSLIEQLNILRSRLKTQQLIRKGLIVGGAGGIGYGTLKLGHFL